jgi:hypothetical protein
MLILMVSTGAGRVIGPEPRNVASATVAPATPGHKCGFPTRRVEAKQTCQYSGRPYKGPKITGRSTQLLREFEELGKAHHDGKFALIWSEVSLL